MAAWRVMLGTCGAVVHVAQSITAFRTALDATPLDRLTAGDLP